MAALRAAACCAQGGWAGPTRLAPAQRAHAGCWVLAVHARAAVLRAGMHACPGRVRARAAMQAHLSSRWSSSGREGRERGNRCAMRAEEEPSKCKRAHHVVQQCGGAHCSARAVEVALTQEQLRQRLQYSNIPKLPAPWVTHEPALAMDARARHQSVRPTHHSPVKFIGTHAPSGPHRPRSALRAALRPPSRPRRSRRPHMRAHMLPICSVEHGSARRLPPSPSRPPFPSHAASISAQQLLAHRGEEQRGARARQAEQERNLRPSPATTNYG